MTFQGIKEYTGLTVYKIGKLSSIATKGLYAYFAGKKGIYKIDCKVKIAKTFSLYYEEVFWPKIEGMTKWEALSVEAKRMQELEDNK